MQTLTYRKAAIDDLPTIVALLSDDELGKTREINSSSIDERYVDAFYRIDSDTNQGNPPFFNCP